MRQVYARTRRQPKRYCSLRGNSTGGVAFSLPGRVGDAPLPGIGFAADDTLGGVACTGWGEHILRVGLAMRANLPRRYSLHDIED